MGHTDLPLSVAGREQLTRLGEAWPLPRPATIVASDLVRARDSASLLAAGWRGAILTTDPRLREMNFGRWDGESWDEIHRVEPAELARWGERWSDGSRAPEGEGFADVMHRVASWLEDALHDAHAHGRREIVVVAHGGSIRALLVHALGLPCELAFRLRLDHARVTGLWFPDGGLAAGSELAYLNSDLPGRSWTGRDVPEG